MSAWPADRHIECLNEAMGHSRCQPICDGCGSNEIVQEARTKVLEAKRLIEEVLESGRPHNRIAEAVWADAARRWLTANGGAPT